MMKAHNGLHSSDQKADSSMHACMHGIGTYVVADASLSHRSFHQAIVTKSPHHRCDISCAMVSATRKYLHATTSVTRLLLIHNSTGCFDSAGLIAQLGAWWLLCHSDDRYCKALPCIE